VSALGELRKLSAGKRPQTAAEKAFIKKDNRRDNKAAYLFLLPWLIGLAVITVGPMVASLALSFTKYNLLQAPKFIGIDNFIRMMGDERLHNSLGVTFVYVFVSVPLQLAAALALAALLDRGLRGLAIYRSIYYLPSLLGSSVAIAVLWKQVFGGEGLVNQFIAIFGIEGRSWIADPSTALSTLITLNVWTFGAPMVIFLAGLRQIPVMYHEAAQMDGASKWQRFTKITLPLLTPIILQPRAADHPRVPGLHAGLHRVGRNGRPGRLDAVLHAVPLQPRLLELRHGLRLGHGLVPAPHHRSLHRDQLLGLEILGELR
jgi:multiple sugar transport system permease protein